MIELTDDAMPVLAIGLVSLAAVSLGAASIGTAAGGQAPGIDDPTVTVLGNGSGPDGPPNNGTGAIGGPLGPEHDVEIDLTSCVGPLAVWYGGLLYFGAFGGVLYLVAQRYSVGAATIGLYATAPVVFSGYFLSTDCSAPGTTGPGGVGGVLEVITQGGISPSLSPLVIAAVFGVALVGATVVMFRESGDQTVEMATAEDERGEAPTVSDLAAAAGTAADRLEAHNADVDNAVYRAWWEMTSLLQVGDPDTATPGEFADAAVEAGMAESDVARLTELFEEVRYGGRDPADREERALAVFRAIETQYGDAAEEPAGD